MMLPQRKSPRLKDYDYSQSGAYFITICTDEKVHHFGKIVDGNMLLNNIGQLAHDRWDMIPEFFPTVQLSDYVVMPNHMHGILFLTESHDKRPVIGNIINHYKGSVTRLARQQYNFRSKIWQPRYHDHIIRNQDDLTRIRDYVQHNPARWGDDTFYG